MKRSTIGILAAAMMCSAGVASATTLSVSVGSGGLFNSDTGSTVKVAPLATEISLGFNVLPNVTLDANVLIARDISDGTTPSGGNATYIGFRPGVRAYLGRRKLRPYVRAALPIQYNSETKTADVGLLVGGGVEYRFARTVGVFGEVIASPFFTNEHLIPVEGRAGVSVHF